MPHENSPNEHSNEEANPNRNGISQGSSWPLEHLHALIRCEPNRVAIQKVRNGWAGRD